jgi:hypothetical protein
LKILDDVYGYEFEFEKYGFFYVDFNVSVRGFLILLLIMGVYLNKIRGLVVKGFAIREFLGYSF